jgi:hypothetical protein
MAAPARSAGTAARTRTVRARPIFGRPRRLGRERHRNRAAWISIERIVLVMQPSSRLVGFILRALGFDDAVDANQYFAFRFRHPEKVSQLVEVGRDRQGFEWGGHVGDVVGDVEHFPRHSPTSWVVGSSRRSRSRGSALSVSPTSGFVSQEAYFLGHPIKLSHSAERGGCLRSRSQENGSPRRANRRDAGLPLVCTV